MALQFETSSDEDESDQLTEENMQTQRILAGLVKFLICWRAIFGFSERSMYPLLLFLPLFLVFLSKAYNCPALGELGKRFPRSFSTIRKLAGVGRSQGELQRFVVCPKCSCIYHKDDIVTMHRDGRQTAKLCMNLKFAGSSRV